MAGLRDILMRFRPAGAPGPASTGVPADRGAELAAELESPLSLLEDTEAEAHRVRDQAAEEAERTRRDADQQAAQIVARAIADAVRVRDEGAARTRRAAASEAAELLASEERDTAMLRRRAEDHMPALVDHVVADVLQDIGVGRPELGGPSGERRERRAPWAPGGSPG